MKRNLAITLTAIMALVCANTAFASEALSKAYSEMTKAELSGLTAKYVDSGSKDYQHAVPGGFEFTSGVIGGKIADFDGDGADELLTVYAENTDKTDSLFVQMYEEKDGKAVLAAESDKISKFLTGEKGGGCVFVKKVDGNDRIFMQYTGEINSYADGADFEVLGLDYNGEKFEKAFEFDGAGSSYTISVEEAESFKKAGLTDTFEFFNAFENEEGKTEYGFSPYYGGEGNEEYGNFNIGALEKDKEILTDITVSTNIFDIYEKIGWEKEAERLAAAEKDGKVTIKVNTSADVETEAAEAKEETKPETAPEKAADEIAVYLNGEKMSFDAAPYIENGTTRVPMRAIFEGLGAQVDWNGETKTVTAEKDGTEIKLTIGEETALVNGEENKLLVPAEIKENRTMVPLRFVSESLGAKVDWDGETKTITITSETANSEEKPVEE